ncbi:MAG: transketolase, partial [Candidatus Levybacteria bacterium]|nr:transketolase [Candidatus Levybacteria bacterium]
FILKSSTEAGSGHPTSSLSSVELMTALFFGGFLKYDIEDPKNPNNDRIIFSKGHATPLFYSLWKVAGAITEEELLTYRKFDSVLEGHPSIDFPHTVFPTGSLGQGLSVGLGIALNNKYLDKNQARAFVLMGDSEMSEGSVWEAIQLASYYKLNNLVGIIDVNRLGQSGETMLGHSVAEYSRRISSFGWETIMIDGHSFREIINAYSLAESIIDKPTMIIAKTLKGKGVSSLEDKEGWHGKALKQEDFEKAVAELGVFDKDLKGKIREPQEFTSSLKEESDKPKFTNYVKEIEISTRQAYGNALKNLYPSFPNMVVLDGEVKNSTFAETFEKEYPERFFEMYIAEQNMAGVAGGLSQTDKIPFASTFSAFWSRAHDQIRMAGIASANIKFVGSHSGVSIGEDGPSQMGLEDISLFRSIWESTVLYPCDAISTEKLVVEAAKHKGLVYLRTTRKETPVIYDLDEDFPIGGSKVLKKSKEDLLTVVTAGITVFEAIGAYQKLLGDGIFIRVIDVYSIKPIDRDVLLETGKSTKGIIVVEDHYSEGGLADAVREAVSSDGIKVWSLAVNKKPKSGKPDELLNYEEINADAIVKKVKRILSV